MNDLRQFYVSSLAPQIEALELALLSLGERGTESRDSINRVAHQLKGSGASYGIPEITDRAIEVLVASGEDIGPATRALIDLLAELSSGSDPGNRALLIIEDDPAIQRLLQGALESPGRDVMLASTMSEGSDAIAQNPDLVILDLFLPDGDGRQLLAELRRSPGTAHTKVIVLSGADSSVTRAECLALGADAFLPKPFDPVSLGPLVDSLLRVQGPGDRPGAVPIAPVREQPRETARPVSVLLAEDDSLVAALIVDRLTRDGFKIVHCADGESALAEARSNPPDVAILDIKMPKMDGFELLTHLREIPELVDIPVIILTAMGSEHDVLRGFSLGADDYLLKPFSPTELAARVQRLALQT